LKSINRSLPLERPAAFFCLVLAAGLILGEQFPGHLVPLLLAAAGTAVFLWLKAPGVMRTWLAAACALLILGYLSIQPWAAPCFPPSHIQQQADGPAGVITGRVSDLPQRFGRRTRFLLVVETFNGKRSNGNLRVSTFGMLPGIACGDRLQFRTRVKGIRNFNNPGAFDYRRYLRLKRVWVSAWVPAHRIKLLAKDPIPTMWTRLVQVRASLSSWITITLPGREGHITTALVTGDRSGVTPPLRQQFNRLGIGHLLAISGLHIGIIATVSFACLYWLARRTAYLVNRGRARQVAALLSFVPVMAYGLIAGFSPSTQQAVIMVSVYLLTLILDRQQDVFNTLAAAALIILIIDPPALFSVSFQLSFTAVFFILYGLACLPGKWLRPLEPAENGRLPARLGATATTFLWVSLFAILGTLPLTMHYFNQVSCIGLLTNFIYIPLVGFITVPLALTASILLPLAPLLAGKLLQTAGFVLGRSLDLADILIRLKWISMHTVTLNWFEVGCVLCLLILGLQWVKLNCGCPGSGLKENDPVPPGRFLGCVRLGVVVISLLLIGDVFYWLQYRFWHRDLRVTCIDVRQGSAALLEFPGGRTMLIDGGGYTDNSLFDIGARVVAPLLWARKIMTVDTLVLTHPNSDHLNGLLYIADRFSVGEIWTNGESAPTSGYRRFMQIVKTQKIAMSAYADLPVEVYIGGARVTRLYPPQDFKDRSRTETWRVTNNNSLVLRVALGEVAFLFAGDIMRPAEGELVRLAGDRLHSSILFVPHHGSRTSSSAVFLDAVTPEVAVISAGWKNRFRFPSNTVLRRLEKIGCRVYRTDIDGAITFSTRGGKLEVETHVQAAPQSKSKSGSGFEVGGSARYRSR